MPSPIQWCRSTAELRRWVERLGDGPIALDTEADSLHHYPEKVCLIQISSAGEDLLVDPLADVDSGVLAPVLGERRRRKILHGADYDLRILGRDHGLTFRGLFDTMIAARLTGETRFGLAALLAKHFDVTLDKKMQRADWSRRPLPSSMEQYAAMDTRFLNELAEILELRLRELGRFAWAEEEFEILESVSWKGREEAEPFRRLKGAGALDRRGAAILRELVDYRERVARRLDRPPFKVLSNDALLKLARARPADGERLKVALRSGGGAGRGWSDEDLLSCVAAAMALPEHDLPAPRRRSVRVLEGKTRRRVEELIRRRDELAKELGLESSMLAPRAVVETAVLRAERGEDPAGTPGLRRWQRELLEAPLSRLAG